MQHGAPSEGTWPPVLPQRPLALEQVLQTQKPFLPLRPVGAGTVVEHLGHILSLAQVVGDTPVPGAVGALGAHARGVTVGIIIRVHPVGLVSPPHRLLLPDPRRGQGRNGKATWVSAHTVNNEELNTDTQTHTRTHTWAHAPTPSLCLQVRGRETEQQTSGRQNEE